LQKRAAGLIYDDEVDMPTQPPILKRTLVHGSHTRCFKILPMSNAGWLASEERDRDVVMHRKYSDWHRVERIASRFRDEIAALRRHGWVEVSA
jgi:hypothetical protein